MMMKPKYEYNQKSLIKNKPSEDKEEKMLTYHNNKNLKMIFSHNKSVPIMNTSIYRSPIVYDKV